MRAQKVTIVGLDRIGASIGLALQLADSGLEITGYERDREAGEQARALGAVTELERNLARSAAGADILILSLPLSALEQALAAIGPETQAHALIVDLGSRKGLGLEWARNSLKQGHYVGAFPVLAAGRLTDGGQGVGAARADLFQQSVFCLTPSPEAEPKAVETAVNLGRALGATPFFLDAMEFDALGQGVQTVPGLLAAALFRAFRDATGWRDMLRFAGPSFALSTSPLEDADLATAAMQDPVSTLRWLDAVIGQLQQVRGWIVDGDEERLSLILADLEIQRAQWLRERTENDWTEEPEQEMPGYGLRTALFGTILGGDDKKRDRKS